MNVYRVKTGSILPLGKQGENLARKIQFDISRWISSFGPGTVQSCSTSAEATKRRILWP